MPKFAYIFQKSDVENWTVQNSCFILLTFFREGILAVGFFLIYHSINMKLLSTAMNFSTCFFGIKCWTNPLTDDKSLCKNLENSDRSTTVDLSVSFGVSAVGEENYGLEFKRKKRPSTEIFYKLCRTRHVILTFGEHWTNL